jgi:hypothetical protein
VEPPLPNSVDLGPLQLAWLGDAVWELHQRLLHCRQLLLHASQLCCELLHAGPGLCRSRQLDLRDARSLSSPAKADSASASPCADTTRSSCSAKSSARSARRSAPGCSGRRTRRRADSRYQTRTRSAGASSLRILDTVNKKATQLSGASAGKVSQASVLDPR